MGGCVSGLVELAEGASEAGPDEHAAGVTAFGLAGVVAVARALALDLDGGVCEVDVRPGERDCFGEPSAGPDQ
jgi:hypothetical protein